MTQKELDRLCRVWQRRLRLSDWSIAAHLATAEEMGDLFGDCTPDEAEQTAQLRVLDCDVAEATLVHELLHIRLLPYSCGEADEPRHDDRERAINLLADCYLRAFPRRRKAE